MLATNRMTISIRAILSWLSTTSYDSSVPFSPRRMSVVLLGLLDLALLAIGIPRLPAEICNVPRTAPFWRWRTTFI